MRTQFYYMKVNTNIQLYEKLKKKKKTFYNVLKIISTQQNLLDELCTLY